MSTPHQEVRCRHCGETKVDKFNSRRPYGMNKIRPTFVAVLLVLLVLALAGS
jgi:hypothetical protein